MNGAVAELSVVIPTRDRQQPLLRALGALAAQVGDTPCFEVIVAIDGGGDGTASALQKVHVPFALRVVSSPRSRGAAAARNLGAAAATAPVLAFLDDDIEAAPGLLAAHAAAHHEGATLTTGYLPAATSHDLDFFQVSLRGWWEAMFDAMRAPDHRYGFRDVLTGNCAINTEVFRRIGGFDEQFRCHEDYELGVRAIEVGARLRFVEAARGTHHECTTLVRAFGRKVDEGRADIAMIRKHPHLVTVLPLGVFEHYATRVQSLLRRLTFERPRAAHLLALSMTASLAPLERARLRGRWQRRLHDLLHYWYWRGVKDAIGTFASFTALRSECRARQPRSVEWLEIDLAHGLASAMRDVDEHRPDAANIRYRGEAVGTIAPVPGAERLRGTHVKGALARELAGPLVAAVGRAGDVSLTARNGTFAAVGPLPTEALPL